MVSLTRTNCSCGSSVTDKFNRLRWLRILVVLVVLIIVGAVIGAGGSGLSTLIGVIVKLADTKGVVEDIDECLRNLK